MVCLLMGQAALTYFWTWVVRSYGDRPIPMRGWVPTYPPKSMRVFVLGLAFTTAGLALVGSELNPWQSGLVAGAVVALSRVPVYVHNLDYRRHGVETEMAPSD